MQKSGSARKRSIQPPQFILIVFSLLVLLSVIGLDFIGWKKDNRSYFFSALLGEKKTLLSQEILEQVALQGLIQHGISSDSIQQFRDTAGSLHLMIDLTEEKYRELEPFLDSEFKRINASILGKEEQQGEEKNYFLWQIGGEEGKALIILFTVQKAVEREISPQRKEPRKKVAIIIDDMGYNLDAMHEICSFQKPLTVSILPFSPFAQETALIAHQNNLEVMLHLPLESVNANTENDIEGFIHSMMSEEDIRNTMERSLDQIPYIKGVNNHMGSRITPNEIFMTIILDTIKEQNLFFVDSRTTTRSIAYDTAQRMNIPSAYRNVFLDGEIQEDYIKGKLIELFKLAQKNEKAVGICHPYDETLKILKENLHLADKYGLELVLVSRIVE
jgi:polysaccharide deacetylase 2 family uncharacterized protein YibQ